MTPERFLMSARTDMHSAQRLREEHGSPRERHGPYLTVALVADALGAEIALKGVIAFRRSIAVTSELRKSIKNAGGDNAHNLLKLYEQLDASDRER